MAGNPVWRVRGGPTLTYFNKPLLYVIASAASKHAGERAVRYAREELAKGGHNDSGLLSHSIKSRVEHTLLGPAFYIYSDLEYSRWVNDGTGLYGPYGTPIVSPTGGVMKFAPGKKNSNFGVRVDHRRRAGTGFSASSSGDVYSTTVQGQPATHFMEKALARIRIVDFVA